MNLSTLRQDIADTLSGLSANVYAYVPKAISAPAVVVFPDTNYVEPLSIGSGKYRVRFRVTFAVNMSDNQAALDNLETLLFDAYAALPNHWQAGTASNPQPVNLGQADLLACDLTLTVITESE